MDFEQIKALIQLVDSSGITEFELEGGDLRLRIRKASTPAQPPAAVPPGAQLEPVAAPMVGTFYRSPAPDAPPFVQEGDAVSPGQVLCVIEAMKMMNEIEAELSGVVRQILVADGQPVEYGQVLMLIERRP